MNTTTAAPLPRRHFAPRRVLLCAMPLLALLLWIVALSGGAGARGPIGEEVSFGADP